MTQEERQLARNALVGWTSLAVQMVVSFATYPLLLDRLPVGHLGLWLVLADLVGHGALLRLGLSTAVLREAAHLDATGKRARFEQLVRSVLTAYLLLAVGVFALALVGGGLVLALVSSPVPDAVAYGALAIAAAQMACAFPFSVYGAVLLGRRRYDVEHALALVGSLARLGAIVAFVRGEHGLWALAWISFAIALTDGLLRMAFARKLVPDLRLRPGRPSRRLLRSVRSFSRHAFVMNVAGRMIHQLDNLAVGLVLGTRWVEVYEAASKPVLAARQVTERLTESAGPAFAATASRPSAERLAQARTWNARTLALGALLCVGLLALGPSFLALYVGGRFSASELEAAGAVLACLAVAFGLRTIGVVPAAALWGLARTRALAAFSIVEGCVNLALSLALAPFLGILGVAVGTLVPKAVTNAVLVPATAGRALGISWRRECIRWRRFLPASAVAALVGVLTAPAGTPSAGRWLVAAAAVVASFAIAWWLTDGRERGRGTARARR